MSPVRSRLQKSLRLLLATVVVSLLAYLILIALVRPSNTRDWALDQDRIAHAVIDGDQVQISNVRNNFYRSVQDFDVHWETRTYDLRRLQSLWYIVEPFADWRGPAHTFLSFGFEDGDYLAISVEIRKEKGEAFSPVLGMLRQYELAYVFGDERDLIGLRANHRRDEVFLYPVRTTAERRRALLVSLLERANQIAQQPEFYHTLGNNCTSNIVRHINLIVPDRIPFSFATMLPAFSDDFAYDLGLIDTALTRDQYRAPHQVNALASEYANRADFSRGIRLAIGRLSD
jgi:hypothetical protein